MLAAKCLGIVMVIVAPGVSPMNEFDYFTMENAKKRCVLHYPMSPCLTKFTKIKEREYVAICGKEIK